MTVHVNVAPRRMWWRRQRIVRLRVCFGFGLRLPTPGLHCWRGDPVAEGAADSAGFVPAAAGVSAQVAGGAASELPAVGGAQQGVAPRWCRGRHSTANYRVARLERRRPRRP